MNRNSYKGYYKGRFNIEAMVKLAYSFNKDNLKIDKNVYDESAFIDKNKHYSSTPTKELSCDLQVVTNF